MSEHDTIPSAAVNASDASTPKKITVRSDAEMRDAALGYAALGLKVFPVYNVWQGGHCACSRPSCKSVGKHPIPAGGYKAASSDAKVVRRWWIEHPGSNIGLACAENGLAAFDIDPRHGGLDGLAELEAAHGPLTSSWEAHTGGAGRHVLFALDADSPITLPGVAAHGIDLKRHGYVLVAPSNHASSGVYEWAEGKAPSATNLPTQLPTWAAELKAGKASKSGTSSGPTGNGDDPAFDAREAAAFAEIEAGGPQPEELAAADAMRAELAGEKSDFATLWSTGQPKNVDKSRSAARMSLANFMAHRFGGEVYTARHHAALRLQWDFAGGDVDSRQAAREWAKSYRPTKAETDGDGFGAAIEDGDPVKPAPDPSEGDPVEPAPDPSEGDPVDPFARVRAALDTVDLLGLSFEAFSKLAAIPGAKVEKPAQPVADKARFLSQITARPLPTVTQIVKGVLTAGEIVIAAGAPGAGKSADLLHLGLCVATGRPFHGRPTKLSGVLFVGSENPAEDVRRIHASMKRHGHDPHAPFLHKAECATLWTEDGKPTKYEAGIVELAKHIEAKRRVPCRLIVIDNLRRVIAPGSANDEAHATTVLKALERIRDATGAAILCIHHTIRDGTRFAGSGAIESHADSVWRFSPPAPKVKGAPSTIAFDKLRLGDKRQVLEYRFGFEVVAHDDDGDEIRTVVVLDAGSARTTGAVEANFGAVADESDGTASLGGWPDAGQGSGGAGSSTAPAAPAAQNALEPRTVAILAALADLGIGGATFQATAVLDAANAKLTARDRKASRMSLRALQIALADLKEAGRVIRTGTGKLTAYSLPETAPE